MDPLIYFYKHAGGLGPWAWRSLNSALFGERYCLEREVQRSTDEHTEMKLQGTSAWLGSPFQLWALNDVFPHLGSVSATFSSFWESTSVSIWAWLWASSQSEELFLQFTLLEDLASIPLVAALPSRALPGMWNAERFLIRTWWLLLVCLWLDRVRVVCRGCWPFETFGPSNCLNSL